MKMFKQVLTFVVLALAVCFGDINGGDLDAIMEQIAAASEGNVSPLANDGKPTEECRTTENQVGECVSYYLCSEDNTIISDGSALIDIRIRDGPCTSYLDICCLPPNVVNSDNRLFPTPDPLPQREGCGWRNPNGVGLFTTGDVNNEAKFAEFPWMVAILTNRPATDGMNRPTGQTLTVYVGGGSLIHPSVVLTTAHYVVGNNRLHVRAGEWDTQTNKEPYPHQDRNVGTVIVHKDFNSGNLFYDIALLFLTKPVTLAPNVGLVCLPPRRERVVDGIRCFASGWGKNEFGQQGSYQSILKKIEMPVVDRRKCQDKLRSTRLGRYFELHSSFMCAGGESGRDTCLGDGGSPLVCPIMYETGRYMQSGIVSWGIGCGENDVPGVYVDVSNLRDWIDDKVANAGYDPRVYEY